jgi:hypothetical protein
VVRVARLLHHLVVLSLPRFKGGRHALRLVVIIVLHVQKGVDFRVIVHVVRVIAVRDRNEGWLLGGQW